MTTPRERVSQQLERLRDAYLVQDPMARAIVDVLKLSLEELKESLVKAVGEDIPRTQGAARHLMKLHQELTTPPPSINAQT